MSFSSKRLSIATATAGLFVQLLIIFVTFAAAGLPVVDKGVFVITGVRSCRSGLGYCILGLDCTVDSEFKQDTNQGHCDGLKKAFTPRTHFVCCELVNSTETSTVHSNGEPIVTIATTTTAENGIVTTTTTTTESELQIIIVSETTTTTKPVSIATDATTTPIATEATTPLATEANSTTTIVESVVTEISLQQTISLQLSDCSARLNIQGQLDSNSETCWIAAIIRVTDPSNLQGGEVNDPGSFICTGAIIHPNIVLTTSTCVARISDASNYQVLYNYKHIPHPTHLQGAVLGGGRIKRAVQHELYRGVGRGNDVGLLLVEGGGGGDYCTVCLGGGGGWEEEEGCIVSGYSHPNEATTSDGLLHEAVQLVLRENCSQSLLCGAGRDAAEACFSPRDSGSPLVCTSPESGHHYLQGVFSHGFHCGSRRAPVYYTNLVYYQSWISSKLAELVLEI